MGLFKKKSSVEHASLSQGRRGILTKIKSSDSQEEEEEDHTVVVVKRKTGRIFRRYKLPSFRRLEEDYAYDDVDDSVLPEEDEYEPPADVFHMKEKREPAPLKEPRIELKGSKGSDRTFDIRDDDTIFDIRDDDTISHFEIKHSDSSFDTEHNDFSQFVFDEAFNTLGTVVVTKSDHGSNNSAENSKHVSQILAAAGDLHKAYLDENSGDTRNVRNGRDLTVIKKEFRSAQKPKAVKPTSLVPPRSDSKLHYTDLGQSRSHGMSMNFDQENNFGTAEPKALFSPLSESSIKNQQCRDEERDRFHKKASQSLLSPQKNACPPTGMETSAMKAARTDDLSHDEFGSIASRSFARPQKSTGRPSIMETRTEKSSVYDEQSQDQYHSHAVRSFAHSQKSAVRPPKTIVTSDQSFASNNSMVMTLDEFTQDHPFFSRSGGKDAYDGFYMDKDPLGEATYWGGDMDPFSQSRDCEKESSVGKSFDAESLIDSIKRSVSRGRQDADESSHKPDPSPRGVHQCNSDSHEKGAVAYASYAARAPPPPPPPPPPPRKVNREPTSPEPEPTSPKQSPREVTSDTQISYWENGSVAYSVGPQKAPPNGGQKNAILASMLFRKTYPGKPPSETPAVKENEDHEDHDDQLPDVPPSILTDESAYSSVSSVTEEASSFYQKNFQSGWKTQANNVLNNYHNARKVRPHNDSSNRSVESHYLERVEEEHANMFSA
jgi:hypothetical protein